MDSHLCLFNTEAYHRLSLQPPQAYLRIDYHEDGRLVGSCAGILDAGTFDSGHRAPFGGIDISGEYQCPSRLFRLIGHVVAQARALGARKIRVRCRPHYVGSCESSLHFALLAQGFQVECAEVSQGIDLSAVPAMETYVERLRSPGRRALRHSMRLGLETALAENEAEWAAGFQVIEQNRAQRGIRLKYSLAYLHRLRAQFPSHVRLLVLRHAQAVIAAALVYRVLPGVHYVPAWGDAGHELPHSPMNFLAHEVVAAALKDGAHVVDLGISSVDGIVNEGLVQFKRNIGASPAVRLDLIREL